MDNGEKTGPLLIVLISPSFVFSLLFCPFSAQAPLPRGAASLTFHAMSAANNLLDEPIRLPPAFRLHRADGPDVLAAAVGLAPEEGAGTFVLSRYKGVLGMAVVLEPEEELATARLIFLLGMAAVADALAAHCPPERPIRLVWPDVVVYDKARLGGGRFAVAPESREDRPPDWLVFAAELLEARPGLEEPGLYPETTSLFEEGFDPVERLVETFASYVMLYADRWRYEGIEAVTNRYLLRVDPPILRGVRRLQGDRMIEITRSGGRTYTPLREALASKPLWRGPEGPLW